MLLDEVIAMNPSGKDMGKVSIEEAHSKGLWHRAVYIYATDGNRVAQRRILEDPRPQGGTRPVWDMSLFVDDVLAGETPEATARRIARKVRLDLSVLRRLEAVTLTEVSLRNSQGHSYNHRTVDYNFAVPCSSLRNINDPAVRLYPIKDLLNDTCHSLRHAASYGHVHRGSRNREIYDKILTILATHGKK